MNTSEHNWKKIIKTLKTKKRKKARKTVKADHGEKNASLKKTGHK